MAWIGAVGAAFRGIAWLNPRLFSISAAGAMYYDPGIKLENASTEKAKSKKRSQFRGASKSIAALHETVETVAV